MPPSIKSPGVYINEQNAFPNSVIEVASSVVAFIGYTDKAEFNGKSCKGKPARVTSLLEYETFFGRGFPAKFTIKPADAAQNNTSFAVDGAEMTVVINENNTAYLYNSIRLFYTNGGGVCYIVSVDTYGDKDSFAMSISDFTGSDTKADPFEALKREYEPALIAVPDAIALGTDCYDLLYTKMLLHCADMKSRFAILDLERQPKITDTEAAIGLFRKSVQSEFLKYGAAYYPWLNTTVVTKDEVTFENIDASVELASMLPASETEAIETVLAYRQKENPSDLLKRRYHLDMLELSPTYAAIITAIREHLNQLPPSGAMAGIYSLIDGSGGVWKAPANVALQGIESPSVVISSEEQEGMNVDAVGGKSINTIREFTGEGTMVWGARTLDGNSQDWRYINVRRTAIMVEQSIQEALKAYVFEPNVSNTWLTVKCMITNFLTGIWKRGGLAGATPEDAFVVFVGLGETMTPDDILEGILRVTVLIALSCPAEFIEITFQQQMMKT
ncbi:phage tail sheath C-terminal domain-containing protein [Flavobacterium sp.]|uniref:phage tail sheath family protein n=1 Tax=Flavobacterium sp. TaxID=239 RepID=UPI00260EE170|nr:phage tail sheath C-terminal domain-containing protein [Flavobacterium sp.]